METETNQAKNVDPIAFTKDRMAEIGEVWKSFALNKRTEAMNRVEGSLDRAPARLKKWLKRSGDQSTDAASRRQTGNGSEAVADVREYPAS